MTKILASLILISGVAFSAGAAVEDSAVAACAEQNASTEALLALGAVVPQNVYSDCYYECKPQSGGDESNGISRCMRECLARHGY